MPNHSHQPPSDNDVLVRVENVGKKFCRDLKKSLWYGMKDIAAELLPGERDLERHATLRPAEFWAVNDVSFELRRGESLGLIGRNGAGKTTLLRLLSGLVKPDTGRITIRGQLSALIALGAGFNPILTGRENIYINASILGLAKPEIDAMLPEIIEFSELEDFIDAPVQSYSSGMHVRLGFSVAVHLNPDIMLVDEALAVGDARFQKKCFDRIQKMQTSGTAFIVVSHNPYQIESVCTKVAVMHKGAMSPLSDGRDALAIYHDLVQQDLGPSGSVSIGSRSGTGPLTISALKVTDEFGNSVPEVTTATKMQIVAEVSSRENLSGVRFRFEICSVNNAVVIMATTIGFSEGLEFMGRQSLTFHMDPCQLTSGWYYINAIAVRRSVRLDTWQRAAEFKVIQKSGPGRSLSNDQGVFVCNGYWVVSRDA
jgi:lipopolysaccharide transport system ATP-binding protein